MDEIHRRDPSELATDLPSFQDPRLDEMLFRYRARNWPDTLTPEEREDWDLFRFTRLPDPSAGGSLVIEQLEQRLSELSEQYARDPAKLQILQAIADWAERVLDAQV
jgi:exodeoxyribonuclease-1